MTGDDFKEWLAEMKRRGIASNKVQCAKLLGRTDQWVSKAQRVGTDHATDLACAALLAGLQPFTPSGK